MQTTLEMKESSILMGRAYHCNESKMKCLVQSKRRVYLDSERRAINVVVSKLEIDDVVAGFCRFVADGQCAVFVVLEVNTDYKYSKAI